ncbi:MAG: Gfo/Idh/MocA family oxidoreductase [Clostridia bacterium]|nr:Gfo/Idh/MocA family oxidoreductase [Clostridia bacterium]
MERIALIGLGRISEYYTAGIAASPRFQLCAVCDLLPEAASADIYGGYPFYCDYRELIAAEKPDWILISTPPKTHFEIASYALSQGVSVLTEKPATRTLAELDALCALSEKTGAAFDVMFHWQWGAEIPALAAILAEGGLERADIEIRDPYSADGHAINADRFGMQGVWLDSGVNALSMLKALLPMERVSLRTVEAERCTASGQPIFVSVCLDVDGVPITLTVDWRQHDDPKRSLFVVNGEEIVVDHMAQTLKRGEKTQSFYAQNRLLQHYLDFFLHADIGAGLADAHRIHEILFEVNERL